MEYEQLELVGFTKNEIAIYITLLKIGPSATGILIKKTGIASSRVYASLDSLIKKGLIIQFRKNKKTFFEAQPPNLILKQLENKKEKLKPVIKELNRFEIKAKKLIESRLHKNIQYYAKADWTVEKVREEINKGLELLSRVDKKIITFFGSHRVPQNNEYYNHCKNLAFELGKKKYAILSGGGPGIMHAANSGAMESKVPSIGLRTELLKGERVTDPIFTEDLDFHFLFVRRFIMSIKSEALIFYPGGYGTLNELFEYLVLMQTGIVDKVPIICINRRYWKGLFEWLTNNPLKKDFFIHAERDLDLIHFADNVDEIIRIIESK
ncbi:MAG TPA: TIGR00730 family Rossman fold protein [Candidatus Nanoarchaeia archaeon]|nr:TIGR00730 family Rossman fold protein [Candidatus Nanoarchaeia archaeon]